MTLTSEPNTLSMKDISSLLTSEKYSDLIIICGDRTFKVHRAIICLQSEFFERACDSPGFKEAATGVITLPDDEPDDVARMVSFFYTSRYDYPPHLDIRTNKARNISIVGSKRKKDAMQASESMDVTTKKTIDEPEIRKTIDEIQTSVHEEVLIHARLYAMGEKYIVLGLKNIAQGNFCNVLDHSRYWVHGAAEILKSVYTSTPRNDKGLRKPIAEACAKAFENYEEEEYSQIFEKIPEARIDILTEQLRLCKEEAKQKVNLAEAKTEAEIEYGMKKWGELIDEVNHSYCGRCGKRCAFLWKNENDYNRERIVVRCHTCRWLTDSVPLV